MPKTQPKTPQFYDNARVRFEASRVLPATPDEVFAALADTPSWATWFGPINKAEWTSQPPHGVGSTRRVRVAFVNIDEEFIVWEPGRRWGFTFTATTLPFVRGGSELVELVAEGEGTRATYSMYLDPFPGFAGIVRASGRGVQKGLADGLRGLERHLAAA